MEMEDKTVKKEKLKAERHEESTDKAEQWRSEDS